MRGRISISWYPARNCWKADCAASIAGKRTKRYFPTREQAEMWAAEKMGDVRQIGLVAFAATIPTHEAVDRMMDRLKDSSHAHQQTARMRYKPFLEAFGGRDLARVSAADLELFLLRIENKTTRAGHFRYLSMLFRWAERIELIPKNPMSRLTAPKATPRRNILTPGQMREVLNLELPDWLRAMVLLGGFAGLRTEEILRMDWNAIQDGQIHVGVGVQKGEKGGWNERYVDFTEPLTRRLGTGQGKIVPYNHSHLHHERRRLIVEPLGWEEWPANCLRHSFATYHLAQYGDAGRTAHQLGHESAKMVYKVYAMPAKRADWQKWWEI